MSKLCSEVILALSALYSFAGISGFVAFLVLGNYPSAVWAFIAGIINSCITYLRWLNYKKVLHQWYSAKELIPISYIGFVCFVIGLMGVGYHLTIEILLKKPILPISNSEVIPIVWSIMTAKSGLLLMWTAHLFSKRREDEETFVNQEVAQENVDPVERY